MLFRSNVTMSEAMTQRFVAQYLQADNNHDVRAPRVYLAFTWGDFGYIVSEFIDGRMCDSSDTALVAAAVQALIAIPSPSSRPGPVGGGLIEHPFFVDRTSSIQYESVEELEDHVNGVSLPTCLASPCLSRTSVADPMITLDTDSLRHGQEGTRSPPRRGRQLRSAPLRIGPEARQLHERQ